jgi:putative hydrolase of the HAD superfamily
MYLSNLHFSFDLWRTLIKSHPNFKKERAKHLHENYNDANKSLSEIESIIRQVDLMCNGINEKTGGNIDAEEMYYMILYQMNGGASVFDKIDIQQLCYEVELLIEQYTPLVYDKDIISTLEKIKSLPNVTLNISSNTGFIKGKTLRKILPKIGLAPFFDFQLYSDEVQASKPSKNFFNTLLHQVNYCRKTVIPKDKIIHVGDNFIADIQGAIACGINTCYINSNDKTIKTLLK